jgi:AbrB family looped-hinge helix DNA binding protein
MERLVAVVTRKGQVTIPARVRHVLNLQRGDSVEFTVPASPSDAITVRRAPAARTSVVEQLFGSLRSDVPMLSPEQEKAAFEAAMAEDAEPLPSLVEQSRNRG